MCKLRNKDVHMFQVRYQDNTRNYGRRFTDFDGTVWQLVVQNDLHVPYFAMVRNGKVGAKLYTLAYYSLDRAERDGLIVRI